MEVGGWGAGGDSLGRAVAAGVTGRVELEWWGGGGDT